MTSDQILLILVGVVGSGKSTVANELETEHGYVRCNQDEMQGNRHLVEQKVYQALQNGKNVVVDRTNFDSSQRSKFLNISSNFPHVKKWALFLDIPKDVCRTRLLTRTNHPTLEPERAIMVLNRFSKDLRPPTVNEGFHRVYRLTKSPEAGTLDQVLFSVEQNGLVGNGIAPFGGNRQRHDGSGNDSGVREHGVNHSRRADERTGWSSDPPPSLWGSSPWAGRNGR
ncbi:Polynucleotide kinase 3' phosphatase [Phaffia rhodozyma]|uniref:Polynucleotide kinase 3' phosphatase n=1 Tax=Phaffia rhodozyma TaxID=264483 RepID=A0A0F7SN61_PHARH|nr:Polynucleotide kinase 3' phosphatase [Phaffia rhodozyma]